MRAAAFRSYGTAEVLGVEDLPETHATPGTIRIRTLAASVNPIDWWVRAGALQAYFPLTFPVIPGRDAAGIVDEIGEGVTGVSIGDLVFGLGGVTGATAEFAVLDVWATAPASWSPAEAAAAGLAAATAVSALTALGDLNGKTLLIEGAAGSVGAAASAIAISLGATVIGTAREANHAFLTALGVTPTTYGPGLTQRVAELAPGGIDLAFDTAGSGSLPELVELTGSLDSVVTVADGARARELGVRAINAENSSAALATAANLGVAGAYTPRVAETLPLESIALAHEHAESGAGKIVILLTEG